MAILDLAAMRADTSNIITDWGENVAFQRATGATILGAGGETTQTWATALTTAADIQAVAPKSAPLRSLGGQEYRPELRVSLRHGTDVRVGDRFTFNSERYYLMAVPPGEADKVIVYASRKAKDDV